MAPGLDRGTGLSDLAERLGIRIGGRVVLADVPPTFRRLLGPLPASIKLTVASGAPAGAGADVIVFFPRSLGDFARRLPAFCAGLAPEGILWVVLPKPEAPAAQKTDLRIAPLLEAAREGGMAEAGMLDVDADAFAVRLAFAARKAAARKPAPARSRLKTRERSR